MRRERESLCFSGCGCRDEGSGSGNLRGFVTTKCPSWGYQRLVLGAIGLFLESFCGHALPKVDKFCSKSTFEIPPRRALRGGHPKRKEKGFRVRTRPKEGKCVALESTRL